MKNKAIALGLTAAALLLPTLPLAHADGAAQAHGGFVGGLLHPFTGADHLAAMLAVGVWSALAVRPVWLAPLAFVLLLAAGAVAGFGGVAVPAVEPMIAASLLVLGLLVALRRRLPLAAAAALTGLFAFFHGAAHGAELGGSGLTGMEAALAGMLTGTAALHAAGLALGRVVMERHRGTALATGLATGLATALLGAGLLVRMA